MAMRLRFKSDPSAFPGGGAYSVGHDYFLSREETCLWIRRGVVDIASMEPTHLTEDAEAAHVAKLNPGHERLTLAEILAALATEPQR
jgi:hypothetical protein